MKRIRFLLFSLFAMIFVLVFSIVSSATEYTVSDSESFKSAYESAVDGDTIIIKSSISATFDFGKSITYILDGNGIVWSAGANNSATGKHVTVLSKNGNNVFKPNSNMWCNSYGLTVKNLSATTWSLGSADESSTLTFDLSVASGRLFYSVTLKEINFLPGTNVTNLNATITSGDTSYIKCTTLNIYDRVKIFGNKSYKELIDATTLNMFGGEIFGNVCTGIWAGVTTSNFNMFGGSIYGNYQPSPHGSYTNANDPQSVGFITANTAKIYGGSIYDNYVGNGHNNETRGSVGGIGTRSGSPKLYMMSDAIHSNKLVTPNTFGEFVKNSDGYYTCEIDESNIVNKNSDGSYTRQFNKFSVTNASHSVLFKHGNGGIIDAFMMNGENIILSVSGSTTISIPTEYNAWVSGSKGTCENATVPVFTVNGAYYGASHNIDKETLTASYPDGFTCNGVQGNPCLLCDFVDINGVLDPIFSASGYANSSSGVAGGFAVDTTALKTYNSLSENALEFGILMFNPIYLGETIFDENMKLNAQKGSLQADTTSDEYSNVGFSVEGFTSNELKDLDLVIAFYVICGDEFELIQKDYTGVVGAPITNTVTRGDISLYTVDFNSVSAFTSALESQAYLVPEKKEN